MGAARIATDDIRERIEEALVKQFSGPQSGAHYVANVTFTNVYLADGVWNRVAADEEAWRRVEAAVVGIPGVARLLRVDMNLVDSWLCQSQSGTGGGTL
jgi:hypothetical protein